MRGLRPIIREFGEYVNVNEWCASVQRTKVLSFSERRW